MALYQVLVDKDKSVMWTDKASEGENGEVHYSVIDGSAVIYVEAFTSDEASEKALEIYKRLTQKGLADEKGC